MRPLFLLAAFSTLLCNSCFSPGDGQSPPLEKLYFPTGLALDPVPVDAAGVATGEPSRYLYIASSDFDLQYRSSSLASYDLGKLVKLVPRSCAADSACRTDAGETCDTVPSAANLGVPSYFCIPREGAAPCGAFLDRSQADRLLNPGRCQAVDPVHPQDGSPTFVQDTVGIGAFATDLLVSVDNDPLGNRGARLFLPVRGDATLHWIDLSDGKFACGQGETDDHSCNEQHRAGRSSDDNVDELRLPAEPFGIAATRGGKYVAVTNQTTGSVSLFVTENWQEGPNLASILSGLPQAPVAIAALPTLELSPNAAPGFLVAYRNAAQVDLLRVLTDNPVSPDVASYTRFSLRGAATAPINANSLGFDSRGIVIDDEQHTSDSAKCAGDRNCLLAAHQPNIYVANRAPSSLLVGSMTADYAYLAGTNELPSFTDSIALTSGPSRVVLGHVKVPGSTFTEENGSTYDLERRVFVVCFDSRRIFVYDPKRRVLDAIIDTGRGPYALVVDDARGLAYVAHFTDSYLGVVSLDQRVPQTYANFVASIGIPSPPRSSK